MARGRGRTGKIDRFYWREIRKTYHELARDWLGKRGERVSDILDFQRRFPEESKALHQQARQHWQREHRSHPRYDTSEPTRQSLRRDVHVPEVVVHTPYVQVERGGQRLGKWQDSVGHLVSAEAVAEEFYEGQGWNAYACERKLITVLYATFCFPVVQDPDDPTIVVGYRNSTRGWTRTNRNTGLIGISLPLDFGSSEHFERRAAAYRHLLVFLEGQSLPDLFEQWLAPSENLRDYLWVNDDAPVALARAALAVVPKADVLEWLEWVASAFWQHQHGWPDLLLLRGHEFRFSEVKSPNDELSQEQMQWFRWALTVSGVPCEVCRVKKARQGIENPDAPG